MSGFIFKLQNVIKTQPYTMNADAEVAKLMLQNPSLAHKDVTISELAKACYTSVSSISRFATNLGYSNFNEMKADYIGIKDEYDDLQVDNSYLSNHTLNEYKNRIIQAMELIDDRELQAYVTKLCEVIYAYDNVYLFATHIPSNIVSIMHRAILSTGKYIEFVQDKHQQAAVAKTAGKEDLFIMVSLDGMLVMAKEITIPILMSQAKRVLVTQNAKVKFAEKFDLVIPLGEVTKSFTAKYKLLLFVDFFINTYFTYVNKQKDKSEN